MNLGHTALQLKVLRIMRYNLRTSVGIQLAQFWPSGYVRGIPLGMQANGMNFIATSAETSILQDPTTQI
jgi:hypothetical protein